MIIAIFQHDRNINVIWGVLLMPSLRSDLLLWFWGPGRAVGEGQYVDFGAVDMFGKWEQLHCGGRQGVLKHSCSNRQKGVVQGARAPWTCCSRGCSPTPRVPVRADPHTAVMGAQRESGREGNHWHPVLLKDFIRIYIFIYLIIPLVQSPCCSARGWLRTQAPFWGLPRWLQQQSGASSLWAQTPGQTKAHSSTERFVSLPGLWLTSRKRSAPPSLTGE